MNTINKDCYIIMLNSLWYLFTDKKSFATLSTKLSGWCWKSLFQYGWFSHWKSILSCVQFSKKLMWVWGQFFSCLCDYWPEDIHNSHSVLLQKKHHFLLKTKLKTVEPEKKHVCSWKSIMRCGQYIFFQWPEILI